MKNYSYQAEFDLESGYLKQRVAKLTLSTWLHPRCLPSGSYKIACINAAREITRGLVSDQVNFGNVFIGWRFEKQDDLDAYLSKKPKFELMKVHSWT